MAAVLWAWAEAERVVGIVFVYMCYFAYHVQASGHVEADDARDSVRMDRMKF